MLPIQTSMPPAPMKLMETIAKPVAVLAGAHVRNMDYNVHKHVEHAKASSAV